MTASSAVAQSMGPAAAEGDEALRFLTKASASTTALEPPCVQPWHRLMWQPGSQPSCLYV